MAIVRRGHLRNHAAMVASVYSRALQKAAELLGEKFPVPVKRLGIRDCFGESGPNDRLLDKYRLSAAMVAQSAAVGISGRW